METEKRLLELTSEEHLLFLAEVDALMKKITEKDPVLLVTPKTLLFRGSKVDRMALILLIFQGLEPLERAILLDAFNG